MCVRCVGQQILSRIYGLSVPEEFKNCLSSYTLICPFWGWGTFCSERWKYLANEVAREWQSWNSYPGCPTPVIVWMPLFIAQLLVRNKGEKKNIWCWWSPRSREISVGGWRGVGSLVYWKLGLKPWVKLYYVLFEIPEVIFPGNQFLTVFSLEQGWSRELVHRHRN